MRGMRATPLPLRRSRRARINSRRASRSGTSRSQRPPGAGKRLPVSSASLAALSWPHRDRRVRSRTRSVHISSLLYGLPAVSYPPWQLSRVGKSVATPCRVRPESWASAVATTSMIRGRCLRPPHSGRSPPMPRHGCVGCSLAASAHRCDDRHASRRCCVRRLLPSPGPAALLSLRPVAWRLRRAAPGMPGPLSAPPKCPRAALPANTRGSPSVCSCMGPLRRLVAFARVQACGPEMDSYRVEHA